MKSKYIVSGFKERQSAWDMDATGSDCDCEFDNLKDAKRYAMRLLEPDDDSSGMAYSRIDDSTTYGTGVCLFEYSLVDSTL